MAIPNEITDEHIDVIRVNMFGWGVVRNAKRRRKLQKRGEEIHWSRFYNAWIWMRKPIRLEVINFPTFPIGRFKPFSNTITLPRSLWAP